MIMKLYVILQRSIPITVELLYSGIIHWEPTILSLNSELAGIIPVGVVCVTGVDLLTESFPLLYTACQGG